MGNNLNRGELSGRDIVNATLPQMALPCYLTLITLVGTRVCEQRGVFIGCMDNWAT